MDYKFWATQFVSWVGMHWRKQKPVWGGASDIFEGLPVPHLILNTLCSKYNYPHYTNEETEAEKV